MLNSSPFIFDLALIMVVAAFAMLLCKWLRQPLILGYLLAGFFVGPNFPFIPTVGEISSVDIWAEFGVIFLLFTLGFNFTLKKLWTVGSSATIIALIKNLTMFSVGPLVAYFLNLPTQMGIFIGAIISITSTIAVARSLDDAQLTEKPYASVIMGILIVEDVLILFLILIIGSLGPSRSLAGPSFTTSLLLKILFVGLIFLISTMLPKFVDKIRHLLSKEMTLILSLAFCLSVSMLSSKVGLSPALGAFIAGMLLSETTESKVIKKLILPIRDLFVAIFFISVGMMISPTVLIENWSLIILLSLLMIFVKSISTTLATLLTKESFETATAIGVLTIPIGEFSFVIATLGITLEIVDKDFYSITVALSAISILASNYLIKILPQINKRFVKTSI